MKKFFLLIIGLAPLMAAAQNVGISNTAIIPDASSILDVQSDSKGVLIPRMTSAQREAIGSPANGLLLYQTDGVAGFYYNEGSAAIPQWKPLQSNSNNTTVAALQRWDLAPLSSARLSMPANMPQLVFDGENIWAILSKANSNNISRIRVSRASPVNYFSINGTPQAIFFDGTYIIVSNGSKLFQINPLTGSIVNSVSLNGGTLAMAFDGYRYWVVTAGGTVLLYDVQLKKITATPYSSGTSDDILFDGKYMWIASGNTSHSFLTKVDTSTLDLVLNTDDIPGGTPMHIAYDGQVIWMSTFGGTNLLRFKIADGSQLASIPSGMQQPNRLQYDGTNMWVSGTNNNLNGVIKINTNNLNPKLVSIAGSIVFDGLTFDGFAMWISSENTNFSSFLDKIEK